MDHLKQLVSLFTEHAVGFADLGDIAVATLVIYPCNPSPAAISPGRAAWSFRTSNRAEWCW